MFVGEHGLWCLGRGQVAKVAPLLCEQPVRGRLVLSGPVVGDFQLEGFLFQVCAQRRQDVMAPGGNDFRSCVALRRQNKGVENEVMSFFIEENCFSNAKLEDTFVQGGWYLNLGRNLFVEVS
jgi:hypothetical protein